MLPTDTSSQPNPATPRQLTLEKQGRRWVFRYAPGQETQMLHSLADAARTGDSDFDWFDAAVLAHQMGEKMRQRLLSIQASLDED
jgi:3-oxoacyl-[acyl-carrier-protein] synthase III